MEPVDVKTKTLIDFDIDCRKNLLKLSQELCTNLKVK